MSSIGTSNSPRGVGIVANLFILAGIAYFVLGIFSLFFAVIYGILMIGGGVLFIAFGFALADLRRWAWWGSIIINIGICIVNSPLITTLSLYSVIGMAIAIIVIIYLISPNIRHQVQ